MSSTLTTTRFFLETMASKEPQLASIACPFTAIFNQQKAVIDMGSSQVAIELFKGNEKVAPLVSRMLGSALNGDTPVITPGVAGANDYLFSLISQDLELPAGILNDRTPGEPAYVTQGSSDSIKQFRRGYWLLKLTMDIVSRVVRKNELLAKQAYFDSEMDIYDEHQGATKLIFPRSTELKNRTVAVSWATAASAKPWDDLGNAFRVIRKTSMVNNNNLRTAFMSSDTMQNLLAVYRSQRANEGPDMNVVYNAFDFDPDKGAPSTLKFLIDNGMEYGGWVRGSWGNEKIHLFTLPEGYDSVEGDSSSNFTDWISGETIAVGLFSPAYFKAYYGPGVLVPSGDSVMTQALGKTGMKNLPALGDLTIGLSKIPTKSIMLNLYPLGKDQGWGATIQHAPIYVPIRPDVVATIDTETTA